MPSVWHDYQSYLALNDIEHTKTNGQSPQANGICERPHNAVLQALYQVTLRMHIYNSIVDHQKDLNESLKRYNIEELIKAKCIAGHDYLMANKSVS